MPAADDLTVESEVQFEDDLFGMPGPFAYLDGRVRQTVRVDVLDGTQAVFDEEMARVRDSVAQEARFLAKEMVAEFVKCRALRAVAAKG